MLIASVVTCLPGMFWTCSTWRPSDAPRRRSPSTPPLYPQSGRAVGVRRCGLRFTRASARASPAGDRAYGGPMRGRRVSTILLLSALGCAGGDALVGVEEAPLIEAR